MRGNEKLLANEDRWVTDLGQAIPPGRVVYRGKDLFGELASLSWMALLLYGITGRIPDERQVRLSTVFGRLAPAIPIRGCGTTASRHSRERRGAP